MQGLRAHGSGGAAAARCLAAAALPSPPACPAAPRGLATSAAAAAAADAGNDPFRPYGEHLAPVAAAAALAARGGFTDICWDNMVEVSARGGGGGGGGGGGEGAEGVAGVAEEVVPTQPIPADQVPAFFREHLKELTAEDVTPVLAQYIDLRFCEVRCWVASLCARIMCA